MFLTEHEDRWTSFCVTGETFSKSRPFKHSRTRTLHKGVSLVLLLIVFDCVCTGCCASNCDSWTATHGNITIAHIKMFYWLSGALKTITVYDRIQLRWRLIQQFIQAWFQQHPWRTWVSVSLYWDCGCFQKIIPVFLHCVEYDASFLYA